MSTKSLPVITRLDKRAMVELAVDIAGVERKEAENAINLVAGVLGTWMHGIIRDIPEGNRAIATLLGFGSWEIIYGQLSRRSAWRDRNRIPQRPKGIRMRFRPGTSLIKAIKEANRPALTLYKEEYTRARDAMIAARPPRPPKEEMGPSAGDIRQSVLDEIAELSQAPAVLPITPEEAALRKSMDIEQHQEPMIDAPGDFTVIWDAQPGEEAPTMPNPPGYPDSSQVTAPADNRPWPTQTYDTAEAVAAKLASMPSVNRVNSGHGGTGDPAAELAEEGNALVNNEQGADAAEDIISELIAKLEEQAISLVDGEPGKVLRTGYDYEQPKQGSAPPTSQTIEEEIAPKPFRYASAIDVPPLVDGLKDAQQHKPIVSWKGAQPQNENQPNKEEKEPIPAISPNGRKKSLV